VYARRVERAALRLFSVRLLVRAPERLLRERVPVERRRQVWLEQLVVALEQVPVERRRQVWLEQLAAALERVPVERRRQVWLEQPVAELEQVLVERRRQVWLEQPVAELALVLVERRQVWLERPAAERAWAANRAHDAVRRSVAPWVARQAVGRRERELVSVLKPALELVSVLKQARELVSVLKREAVPLWAPALRQVAGPKVVPRLSIVRGR